MARKDFPRTFAAARAALALCLVAMPLRARGQSQPQAQRGGEDVVRVETDLVQTDVMVFDKSGKFVDGLKREQFEVKVDGQIVPVQFFERITAGSPREENARSGRAASGAASPAPPDAHRQGRHVAFFLDDVHLSAGSIERTRKTVTQYFERGMLPGDMVLVASVAGQPGFLQQFTDNKAVLRAALARIAYKPYVIRDAETVPMTEYQALRIEQGDRDALNYYVAQLMKEASFKLPAGVGIGPPPGGPVGKRLPPAQTTAGLTRDKAERMVRDRASLLMKQSSQVSFATLTTLESLIRSAAQVPGRKLVFFFSDGFYLNDRDTGFGDKLKRITDAAVRAGVVVYTLDARGLVSMTDAGSNRADPGGQLARANVGEFTTLQDPLTALAADTGGRAHLNSYALDTAVGSALAETSNYYRIAWKPGAEELKGGKFKRVEVSVVGRPDLTVRLPRGYMASLAAAATPGGAKAATIPVASVEKGGVAKDAEGELRDALTSPFIRRALPMMLSTSFVDVPGTGPVLTSSVQVGTDGLSYGADGKKPAAVDVVGVVLNDQGKQATSFKTRLNVTPLPTGAATAAGERPGVIYNHRAPLAPGLYQIRAAARDAGGGQVGSAAQWIEIPDLSKRRLALSSLHLGGRSVGGAKAGEAPQVQFSVDRRFPRSARLDFLAFIYNAARTSVSTPFDLSVRIQVLRDNRAVVSAPARKLTPDAATDPARIPLTGAVSLGQLPAGLYEIEVTVNDNLSKATATQRVAFEIQ
jgi:VWFA-related protein